MQKELESKIRISLINYCSVPQSYPKFDLINVKSLSSTFCPPHTFGISSSISPYSLILSIFAHISVQNYDPNRSPPKTRKKVKVRKISV